MRICNFAITSHRGHKVPENCFRYHWSSGDVRLDAKKVRILSAISDSTWYLHDGPRECLGSPPKRDPIRENVATKFSWAPSVSGTESWPRRNGHLRPRARRDQRFAMCDHPMNGLVDWKQLYGNQMP
jgi:hypothetical protein